MAFSRVFLTFFFLASALFVRAAALPAFAADAKITPAKIVFVVA